MNLLRHHYTQRARGSTPFLLDKIRNTILVDGVSYLAEDEGFEPPQTESESGVLPLHKSSIASTQREENVKNFFPKFKCFFLSLVDYPKSSFLCLLFFPGKRQILQNMGAQIAKCLLIALIPQHFQ